MTVKARGCWVGLVLVALLLSAPLLPTRGQERPPEFEEMYQRGFALYQAGKYLEALPLAQQFMEIAAAQYGEEHSYYATSVYYVAVLHEALNHLAEAEELFLRALALKEKALGADH